MLAHRARNTAFTLIELLVTVGIVAILVACLVPAFQSARMNGLITVDRANLRTIQAANIAYMSDHNGIYVPDAGWDANGSSTFWYQNTEFRTTYLGIAKSGAWPDKLISPLATNRDANGQRMIERSYGYNYKDLGGTFGEPGSTRQAIVGKVSHPSQTLAFADALDWQIDISGANAYPGIEVYTPHTTAYRYKGRAGVVFFDGHMAMLTRDQVVNNKTLWEIYAQ